MSDVWSTGESYKIFIGADEFPQDGPVTAAAVTEAARNMGYKKFKVYGADDSPLTRDDFPYPGNVTIRRVNQAA